MFPVTIDDAARWKIRCRRRVGRETSRLEEVEVAGRGDDLECLLIARHFEVAELVERLELVEEQQVEFEPGIEVLIDGVDQLVANDEDRQHRTEQVHRDQRTEDGAEQPSSGHAQSSQRIV